MLQNRSHVFKSFTLLLLWLAMGVFAVENIDCVNYSGEPDSRCMYLRVLDQKGFGLYVVPEGEDVILANALTNETFYVYAPLADNDSIDIFQIDNGTQTIIGHMEEVNSGDAGYLQFGIKGWYPYTNIYVGTSVTVSAEPSIFRVYNFYAPALKYYVDGEEITDISKLQLEVGDSIQVDVYAVVTLGPNTNSVDTTVDNEKFFISTTGDCETLVFKTLSGTDLQTSNGEPYVTFSSGKASFLVYATKSITDGSTFALSGYEDSNNPDNYFVEGPFPGELQVINPDMPTLESAVIFDTDGDGMGDSISALFDGNMDSVEVMGFYYNWPLAESFTQYSGDEKQSGLQYGLPDITEVLQEENASGVLKAYVCTSVGNRCDTLSVAIQDSIGAVIQKVTLVKGDNGKDTLVVRFNKDVDESWNEGEGLMVNGTAIYAEAIEKEGSVWTFVVDQDLVSVGDKIKIQTICSETDCPEGILTAADGIPTSKNNQEVTVESSGRVYASESNGFYDKDGDGRMDSVSIEFETPISESDLKNMELTIYWLDNDGNVIEIRPSSSDLVLSSDGKTLGISVDSDKYNIMENLTSVDETRISSKSSSQEYGYAMYKYTETVDGESSQKEIRFELNDYMAPVIADNFLSPESFQYMSPDKFTITFSEPIDYSSFVMTDDCLSFYVDGAWVNYSLTSVEWSDDGRTATFYMEAGQKLSERMNPADSVTFGNFTSGIVDKSGNNVREDVSAVMVKGDPRVIMETTSFADLNRASELSDRVKPFTIDHVKESLDEENASSLGVLLDVGFSTIMKSDSGVTTLDLENTGLTWELYIYTNMGTFVGSASGKISCDDEFFDGNCFENSDKLYVRWNMRSDDGRRAGVGVYLAKFKVKVFGAKNEFLIERVFRWGITASKK